MTTRLIAAGLVGLSIVYLALFVPRGWIPHDEGMIGQSAERVLNGERPHVDYEEPYTGGLAWLHALVFKLAGIDLIYLRWLLFAGVVLAQLLTYLILRRYVQPIGAAIGTWVALSWSFPNYFAALPSWWLLICALACVWAFLRYAESRLLRYAAAAGLAAGISILIKQTGLYVLVALVMALLYSGGTNERDARVWWPGRLLYAGAAIVTVALAFAVLVTRLSLSDLVYLMLPILACSCVLLVDGACRSRRQSLDTLAAPAVAVGAAALPLVCFITPYLIDQQIGSLVNGVFVLPQKRVQFAALEMPPAHWILAGLPLLAAVMPLPAFTRVRELRPGYGVLMLCVVGALLLAATPHSVVSYQIVWQAARAFAALLPVAICGMLICGNVRATDRRILFAFAAFLAWASLVQVPFSAPIYFCYVAPLAVIAAVAVASHRAALTRPMFGVSVSVVLAFALFSMNRGYLHNLGLFHQPLAIDTPLNLDRASLRVSQADTISYRRIVELVGAHIGEGQLVAGPDAPEVYFLTGRFSPSGTLFDFFTNHMSAEGQLNDMPGLSAANVVVLTHDRRFSLGVSAPLAEKVRRLFPTSEGVGTLEVRWR
jgi:hypothetical protein